MNLTVKCPACGGAVVMDPESGRLKCTQCDKILNAGFGDEDNSAMVRAEDGELIDKRSYKAAKKIARIKRYITETTDTIYTLDEINLGSDEDSPRYMEMNLYECTSCGAKLMVKSTESSSFCAYCGQPMILVDRVTDELEPDVIIPFGISQRRAEQLIRERFCKGLFVPQEIKNFRIDKVRGIYIPYWLMSYHVRKKLKYSFQESKKGRKSGLVSSWSGKDSQEVITHHCMKDCECTVARMPSDASRKLNDSISERLEPYDMDRALAFSPEYLSGFYTDRYDVPATEFVPEAKRRSDRAVKQEMLSDIGISPRKAKLLISEENTDIRLEDIEYALLPAWFMTFNYRGIMYSVAVNGQTGKVVGNVPSDKFKVGAALGILTTLMVVICTYVSVFMGRLMMDRIIMTTEVGFYVVVGFAAALIYSVVYFWRSINKLHRSRIDIHRFRSHGTIEYVKERQDKTWVR